MIEFHPLANIFPLIEGAEFHALVEDIAQNGVHEPLVIYDGMILDGRNRYRAACINHVPFETVQYEGRDPLGYVVSLNLRRRHLDESQRAVVAAKIANMKVGGKEANSANLQNCTPVSQATAAEMLNVSTRTVSSARAVIDEGAPELVAAVERGEASVSAAADLATLPIERQQEIVAEGPAAIKEAAAEIRHHRSNFTGNNEWYTPAQYVELARDVLGVIDVDPASNDFAQIRIQANRFYTEETDGLTKTWCGNVWLNPPYAQPAIGNFIDKMVDEWNAGRVQSAIVLTHNYTDTAWFQKAAKAATSICFTRGRVKFEGPNGEVAAPTQGQAFFYFGANIERFCNVFSDVGFIVEVC